MTGHDTRRYDMLTRVRGFGATYAQLFPDTSTAHDAFASVATEIERLEALDVAERSAFDGSRATRKDAARTVFQDLLKRAGSTARVLGRTNPQLEVRIPRPLPKDDLQLLSLARQFAAGVTAYGTEFAARGIPLPTLDAGIAAFEEAVVHHGTSREEHVKARAEREATFARAMHAVETLDVTVANCVTDPVALALWKHGRRIGSRRRSGAGEKNPGTAAAPPPTSTTAAPPPAHTEPTASTEPPAHPDMPAHKDAPVRDAADIAA